MLIEAIGKPLTYRWPGGEVYLEPGEPIDLPDDRGATATQQSAGEGPCVPARNIPWRSGRLDTWRWEHSGGDCRFPSC